MGPGSLLISELSKDHADVEKFFEKEKPEYVFLAAGKVGGIKANINYPAEFIFENTTNK